MNDKGSTAVAAYVDNLGVLKSADRQVVDEGLQRIIATLRGWGLLVHEIEPASQRADFVGRGTVSIKKTRINRIKFAIDELLERQVCSGRTMQLLVGHLTWALLCRRCGLSLINACYAFIGDGSNQNRRLWKSVRQELQWVSAILPLLKFHVNSSWSPDITSSEASPWGYGVCYRTVDSHVAESIGRSSERWRFLFADATNAREHAFSPKHLHDSDHLGDEQPGINSEHLHGSHQPSEEHPGIYSQLGDDSGVHYRFISDGVFTEIPVDILNPDDWSIAWSRPWRFEANILNTEARALVWSAEHLLRCSRAFGRRLVCLTDNLPSALGVTKGRAKSTHLLRPLRKLCALSLATKSKVHVRWLPSERNVADVPSRATDIWEAQGLRGWWNSPVRHVEDGSKGCEPSVAEVVDRHVSRHLLRQAKTKLRGSIPEGLTYLEARSVREPTRLDYMRRIKDFNHWLGPHVVDFTNPLDVDNILVEYLQDLFDSGFKVDSGIRIHAAIRFCHPQLGKSASGSLPRCLRALRGWKNADPPLQRMPLPIEGFGAILGYCIATNFLEMAVHLFVQWMTYMRPGEASSLTTNQLIPPMSRSLSSMQFFAVLLHPAEGRVPGKTGHFDQGILLDSDLWINPILMKLIHMKKPSTPLWNHTHMEILNVFQKAVKYLQLEPLGVSMYTLRHGGASYDIISQRKTMDEVKQRGRWSADSSLRRYVKTARIQSELHKIHPKVIEFGRMVLNNLPELLNGSSRITKLPFGTNM